MSAKESKIKNADKFTWKKGEVTFIKPEDNTKKKNKKKRK